MDANRPTEHIETVIIGAGQAGLSAAYHLSRRGVPYVVLDADARIGDHWRERWPSLRLYSPAYDDSLPGMRFPSPAFSYPTGREMGDYLEAYAKRFDLHVRSGTRVDEVRPAADGEPGYVVTAGDRQYRADQVVIATGPFGNPFTPPFADQLDPSIDQLHSHAYRGPTHLARGPVLVVGASHSGADIAFEVARSHATTLAGTDHGQLPIRVIDTWRARIVWPIMSFVFRHVLTVRTPMGRAMAPHVRAGGGPLLRVRRPDLLAAGVERQQQRVVGVRDGKPQLADGSVVDVATVIWCTGYRPDYGWIRLPDVTGEDGWPRERRGVAPAAGLYFLGIPFTYAFSSMLVGGAGRDARYVVDRIVERMRARGLAVSMTPATAR
jgi:putative flavoprotein involved in K+ transport